MPVPLRGTPSMRDGWLKFPRSVAIRGTISRPTKASAAPNQGRASRPGHGADATACTGTCRRAGTRTGVGLSPLAGCLSDKMAPLGQAERHASHSRQRSCSTLGTPSTRLMAPVGHASMHRPQPVQRASSTYTTVVIFFLTRARATRGVVLPGCHTSIDRTSPLANPGERQAHARNRIRVWSDLHLCCFSLP